MNSSPLKVLAASKPKTRIIASIAAVLVAVIAAVVYLVAIRPRNASTFPPPFEHWDVAVQLSGRELAAAQFLADTLPLRIAAMSDDRAMDEWHRRVRWDYEGGVPSEHLTGGITGRIAQVRPGPEGYGLEIDSCEFDMPGQYIVQSDGTLKPNSPKLTTRGYLVAQTTDQSRAGDQPTSPRWLLWAYEQPAITPEDCGSLLPSPYIQETPTPVAR